MKEEVLSQLHKPGRYLGNEWNVPKKGLDGLDLKAALCFPDIYEVGMSHLGFRIIYGLLNEFDGVLCERVFMPAEDLESLLRKENMPLTSLESDTPLNKFDIIGFSISYELLFTNILKVLELSGIPYLARKRNDAHPLIIGGGYACVNPEPIADFFDCFIIGEAEELLPELIEEVKSARKKTLPKKELLRKIAKIPGVYVPCFYDVEYNSNGAMARVRPIDEAFPAVVKKRVVLNLDSAFYPRRWLVPYVGIVHDRAVLEIMRGCPHKCKFCQANSLYSPWRLRSPEKIMEMAGALLNESGYEEISLLGLSCGDYPKIGDILARLFSTYKDKGIGVSLPSLKIKDYLVNIPVLLGAVKKAGLTFAPEAGSERLRKLINKDIRSEDLFNVAANAYKAGYRHIKLYFMIGLPQEEYEDLDAIIELVTKIVGLRKDIDGRLGNVHLSVNAFIPKPHTEFERLPMDSITGLRDKQKYILAKLREYPKNISRAIKIDFSNLEEGYLEAVLSRADRRAADAIVKAHEAKADSKLDIWRQAFSEAGIDPDFYARRPMSDDEITPWAHIVTR